MCLRTTLTDFTILSLSCALILYPMMRIFSGCVYLGLSEPQHADVCAVPRITESLCCYYTDFFFLNALAFG